MKRKLVQQGNGALTLTLPSQWVDKNNLEKGDYLHLVDNGKDLFLSSEEKKNNVKGTIELSDEFPFFKRYLNTMYVMGYDTIVITSDKSLPILKIKETLSYLIGYEITEQTVKRCVISIVAIPEDQNFNSISRRIFFMIDTMFHDAIDAIKQDDFDSLKDIAMAEKSIETFTRFCQRILTKQGYSDFSKTPYMYYTLSILEECADAIRDALLDITHSSKELLFFLEKLKKYFTQLHSLFFDYDKSKISVIKELRLSLFEKIKASDSFDGKLDLYVFLQLLHQFEVSLDPLNKK